MIIILLCIQKFNKVPMCFFKLTLFHLRPRTTNRLLHNFRIHFHKKEEEISQIGLHQNQI